MTSETKAEQSLFDLEWPELKAAIAACALSDLGRQRALALGPTEDQQVAETRLSVLKEVLLLAELGAHLPAGQLVDIVPTAERLKRAGVASGVELSGVLRLLRVASRLHRFSVHHGDEFPLVGAILELDPEIFAFESTLESAVDEDGEVRDDASPGLFAARAEKRKLLLQMKKRAAELIVRYRDALQDGYYAERDGRTVLPVRSDAPFRVEGIVLGTSASGSTLYVEPRELGQLGNQLSLCDANIEREVALVLSRISGEIAPHSDELMWAQDVAVRADLLRACADFSNKIDARVVPFGPPGSLNVREARHPLLCLTDVVVVPSDLRVGPDVGLVLSGPNAGGKTVALKTLGLLALLQSSGLPVPVHEQSEIGFFDEVLCDIGDDQSLSMSLSSFSGHVKRVREIMETAAHGSLVLFDELMSGTDPDEGAALAIATVDQLVRDGAAVVVTTHYEPLKLHAASVAHLENAAVGFDFEKMDPTFRVEMGRPGASSALIVAKRHGLPDSVTERAEALLPEVLKKSRRQSLGLEEQAVLLDQERKRLVEARQEQEAETRRLALEVEKLKEARRRVLSQESDGLRSDVRDARAELRSLRKRMKGASLDELREIETSLDKTSSVVALGSAVDQEVRKKDRETPLLAETDVRVGMRVSVHGFTTPGEVVELPKKGKVRVLVGVMKMSVPLSELSLPTLAKNNQPKSPQPSYKNKKLPSVSSLEINRDAPPVKSEDVTLDLRGRRVEDSLDAVDSFIDELLRRQEKGGFILHGHGTGALKEALRQHLRAHVCIDRSRAGEREEGGDAFTVFWLSGS